MIKDHLIVIPFNIPWEWSTDYTNQTAYVLRGKNIVICYMWSEAFSIKEYLQKGKIPKIIIRHSKNLYLYYPLYLIPFRRFKFVSTLNSDLNIFLLKIFVKYFEIARNIKKKIVWIFYPNLVTITEKLGKSYFIIYDCVDFFEGAIRTHKERAVLQELERKLTLKANIVTANSTVLQKHLMQYRKDIPLVPQGFRVDSFKTKVIKAPKLNKGNKPLIGFLGAVNHRLDYKLLYTLAQRNLQWRFAIWGPLLEKEKFSKEKLKYYEQLIRLENVITGKSEKSEVPEIIKQFDVGMIPYDSKLDFNKYCYPMKLFEYFYAGIPVVSTPIDELKRFPKFVKIGNNPEEWETHIKNLLSKPWLEKYKLAQKRLAEENSWENKVNTITNTLTNSQN